MATSPDFGAGQAWPQPSQRLRPGWPHSVPGGADAASLRAAQGFNATPGVPGYTTPMAPAEPVNLRGGSGVNPTMPVATAPVVPAEPAPKVGMGRAIANTLRTSAGYVGAGLKASTPMAIGAAAGAIQNKIDASAPEQAPFVPPAATAAGIPIDPNGPRGPAKIESHPLGFGPDNEFTRNLANTMNALPGTGPAMNVLRGGSTAAKLLTAGENTARVGAQVVRGAQSVPGYVPPEREGMFPATAQPVGSATQTDTQRGGATGTPALPAPSANNILRQDKSLNNFGEKSVSYSGKNIREGATINGGPGRGSVSSLDTREGFRQDQLEIQRLVAERREREAGYNAPAVGIGPGQGGLRGRRADRANALIINAANNETLRLNNERTNQTTLRGQDVELEGRMAPARLAAQQRGLHAQVYKDVGASGAPSANNHLAAAAQFDAMGLKEQAAEARAAATSTQALSGAQDTQSAARAADTEKVFRSMFTRDVKDAQGNAKQEFDDVAAAKAAATVRGIYGEKFDSLTPAQKRSAYTEIAAKQKNQEAERQVMPGIGDAALDLVGLYDKPAEVSSPRDLRGGKVERAGLISRPGVDRNSTLLRLPSGQTINYGVADAPQLEDIQRRLRN